MLSIGEAVPLLHAGIRLHFEVVQVIAELARDSTSRLAGIRDVILHMLPAYMRDPRRSHEHFDAALRDDTQCYERFIAEFGDGSGGVTDRMFDAFPEVFWHHLAIKFHNGYVSFQESNKLLTYDFATPQVRYPLVRTIIGDFVEHIGAGIFVHDNMFYPEPVRGMPLESFAIPHPTYNAYNVLPCGLLLQRGSGPTLLFSRVAHVVVQCDGYFGRYSPILHDDYGAARSYDFRETIFTRLCSGFGGITVPLPPLETL